MDIIKKDEMDNYVSKLYSWQDEMQNAGKEFAGVLHYYEVLFSCTISL